MKRCFLFSTMIFLFFFAMSTVTMPVSAATVDRIVAVVNDGVITQSQLDEQINLVRQQMQHSSAPMPSDAQLRRQVLQQLIDQQLQLQIAKNLNLKVEDKMLEQALTQIATQNNFTLAELPQKLQEAGINYQKFREQIRRQILIQQVQQHEVGPTVTVSQQEAEQAAKTVSKSNFPAAVETHVRHIALKVTPLATEGVVKARLVKFRNEIMRGANFADLANTYSEDPSSVGRGGDLGWAQPGTFDPAFEKAMNELKINQISQPLKTQFGWHIIQVLGRKPVENLEAYHSSQTRNVVYQRKYQQAIQKWLQQLRKQGYVKIVNS